MDSLSGNGPITNRFGPVDIHVIIIAISIVMNSNLVLADLMLASTSHILTEPPTQIKKYVDELSGVSTQVHVSSVSMVKERVILACHRCDYKSFHRHALDRHIQVTR